VGHLTIKRHRELVSVRPNGLQRQAIVMFIYQGCHGDDQFAFDKCCNGFGGDMLMASTIDYDGLVLGVSGRR
jgi:hypothetical protein